MPNTPTDNSYRWYNVIYSTPIYEPITTSDYIYRTWTTEVEATTAANRYRRQQQDNSEMWIGELYSILGMDESPQKVREERRTKLGNLLD